MSALEQPKLFNSPLETGIRSAVILHAASPNALDMTHMTWLDHLVVHTGDLGGPPSLHPDLPQRAGELVVRRQLVEQGLSLMARLHMIEARYTDEGILYSARDEASIFIQLVRTEYGRALKSRADWLTTHILNSDREHLAVHIREKVGRWTVEFQMGEW